MTAVQFKQDSCCFSIYLDKLLDLPLKNIKKLLFTMCSEPWNNELAIFTTSEFLAATVPTSKQASVGTGKRCFSKRICGCQVQV